jgi:excinuclease ABC subunit C
VLTALGEQMAAAAAALEFERATSLRDKLASLQRLDDRLSLLRTARDRGSFVYPITGADGCVRWYLIHHGEVRAVALAPTAETAAGVAQLLTATFSDHPPPAILTDVAVDSVLLVSGWFRKRADERAKLLTGAAAGTACAAPPGAAGEAGAPALTSCTGTAGAATRTD